MCRTLLLPCRRMTHPLIIVPDWKRNKDTMCCLALIVLAVSRTLHIPYQCLGSLSIMALAGNFHTVLKRFATAGRADNE